MPYLRDRVVILRSVPFREHDRMIVMFGWQHGLMEAVARGSGLARSKQAGHLTPMSEIDVMIAKGAMYDKLAVARITNHHRGIRKRLGALAFVGSFFDLFERMQKPGIVDETLYALLVEVLEAGESIPDEPSRERTGLLYAVAALKLLDRVGLAPALTHCASCREEMRYGEFFLIPHTATLTCADCYRVLRSANPNAEMIDQETLKLIRFLRKEPIRNVFLLTGRADQFVRVSSAILCALKAAPLQKEPHGLYTISALLSQK
ncbi:DNA repair protein RecO [Patescibacteria group bacterium]|uniref:DNA repair protein RecO n=1 Tax=candidate division WWE3 bacterium TaxID=2053526 RepID=A0A928TUB6_UNCKA|nr:DNA repair protein RecO [candidate division WWE3 bacterium]MCL4732778.1 DNA repair protein RecO [Patescibacteria group bacterium]MDL1952905.1 DNA repair protein RecO [Candidatus Uhrbacteria bacterium UHB]RIL00625.1 MAG: DNA repair protein RecO [Candidatus Uhrbacteria bacterium]